MYSNRAGFNNPYNNMSPFGKDFVQGYVNGGDRDFPGMNPFVTGIPAAGAILGTVGMADNLTGQENMFNSGEFIANGAIAGAVPLAGGVVGSVVGAMGNSARQGHRLRKLHKSVGLPYERKLENMDGRSMGAAATLGGMIGAASTIPGATKFMMNDEPPIESRSLGSALSMKDRQELNALLEQHSDGPAF